MDKAINWWNTRFFNAIFGIKNKNKDDKVILKRGDSALDEIQKALKMFEKLRKVSIEDELYMINKKCYGYGNKFLFQRSLFHHHCLDFYIEVIDYDFCIS